MVGDLDANVERLRAQLRQMSFPAQKLDVFGLREGQATALLPILHFAFLDFSIQFAQFLSETGHEMRAKSDLRFMEEAYKVLRQHLSYSPVLTVAQFFSQGFAERKVLLCQEVLRAVLRKHEELTARRTPLKGRKEAQVRRPQGAINAWSFGPREVAAPSISSSSFDPHAWAKEAQVQIQPQVEPAPFANEDEVRPQTPPKPCSMDGEHMSKEEARPPGTQRLQGLDGQSFEVLLNLLMEIRSALDLRFQRLEQKVDAEVEKLAARTTVLEGDVRIISARFQESAMARPLPASFPAPRAHVADAETRFEATPRPLSANDASSPSKLKAEELRALDASRLERLWSPRGKALPVPRSPQRSPVSPSVASASIQDTQALLAKLEAEFQGTQDLLLQAQATIHQSLRQSSVRGLGDLSPLDSRTASELLASRDLGMRPGDLS